MKKTIPARTRPSSAIALALVTLLALLIAPVCAPICAARSCFSAAGASAAAPKSCHEMASAGAVGARHFAAPSKNCGALDFSVVLVRADYPFLSPRGARSGGAPAAVPVSTQKGLAGLLATLTRWGVHRTPPASSDSAALLTILRI